MSMIREQLDVRHLSKQPIDTVEPRSNQFISIYSYTCGKLQTVIIAAKSWVGSETRKSVGMGHGSLILTLFQPSLSRMLSIK